MSEYLRIPSFSSPEPELTKEELDLQIKELLSRLREMDPRISWSAVRQFSTRLVGPWEPVAQAESLEDQRNILTNKWTRKDFDGNTIAITWWDEIALAEGESGAARGVTAEDLKPREFPTVAVAKNILDHKLREQGLILVGDPPT